MKDSPLISKSKIFALNVLSVCKQLRATKCEPVLINQFIRSGTSVGEMSLFNKKRTEHTTPNFAVCGIVEIDNKILLVRHTYGVAKDRILLPGGYVKENELPTFAIEREI